MCSSNSGYNFLAAYLEIYYLFSFQELAKSKAHQVRCAIGNIFDKYGKPLLEVNIAYIRKDEVIHNL